MLAGIDGVEVEQLDLMAPASIDAFADRFLATGRPLRICSRSGWTGVARPHAVAPELADRLWDLSEQLTGSAL